MATGKFHYSNCLFY